MNTELEKRAKQEVGLTSAEQLDNASASFSPDVDIYVNNDKLAFIIELPGVKKGDVKIELNENNTLIIKAKNSCKEPEPEKVLYRQYSIGDYYRAFQISDEYDKNHISANLEHGLLQVTIPKREEARPRRIEIKA